MTMFVYTLRAESAADLMAMLVAAQAGKPPPFVFEDEEGRFVDAARITYPRPEMAEDEPTGLWLCEVRLMEADAELAAIAHLSGEEEG
jgi:hypothetical protein